MRRIDVIGIGIGIFIAGGAFYVLLDRVGLDSLNAGIWSQVLLVGGLIGWVATYLFRFATKKMTYHQQLQDYTDAVLQKRWEKMTDEERQALLSELNDAPDAPQRDP
ncbi:hypothetical protein AY599_18720 [Leptolyngbya valderiana BDU 20041]|nr:DUF3007 family protein [Geitlerinema sp. CS-897]OAB61420.1 hypothetical protein AY599_18720 [Leptolyngbya valderiana BDU 20041]PPT10064.1 hypothetical protein CKA32_000277 [Geitlerinema sp. FC II]